MSIHLSHYPSLELCKKLTEAGWTDAFKVWCMHKRIDAEWNEVDDFEYIYTWLYRDYDRDTYICECPSVMEILDKLPQTISLDNEWYWLVMRKNYTEYYSYNMDESVFLSEMSLPNALALAWLWIRENNIN
jgi:hypothetical protein